MWTSSIEIADRLRLREPVVSMRERMSDVEDSMKELGPGE
jgi:hypothetical protein